MPFWGHDALWEGARSMETFYTADRNTWREWLSSHFETEKEIWFVFPMKASGEESLSYNDAVEEALCFGWIDSTIKHIDPLHRAQRFTPRNPSSVYSRPNIERLSWLNDRGLLHPAVRENVLPLITAPYVFPKDILSRLRADPVAWENYNAFPDAYRRIRVAYIDAARKRPEEFEKRMKSFLEKTRQNRRIPGFGGIDKYYEQSSREEGTT